MSRFILSNEDGELFSGSKPEMVHYVTSTFMLGASNSPRPASRAEGKGVEPAQVPATCPAPPAFSGDVLYSVSLADHIENGAWPVCDMDGWEGTE